MMMTMMMMMMMFFFFCPSDVVGDRKVGSEARYVASGGTDPPPEPNGAGPPSTCARHGTVFGTAPGVFTRLTQTGTEEQV